MPLLRRAALAAAIATSAIAAQTQALTLGRGVESPPDVYTQGVTQTGRTYQIEYADPRAVDYVCRLGLGEPPQRGGSWWGCYRVDMDAVIIPAKGAWREAERQRIVAHEWAHARGWRHNPDGRGTAPTSLPPRSELALAGAQAADVHGR